MVRLSRNVRAWGRNVFKGRKRTSVAEKLRVARSQVTSDKTLSFITVKGPVVVKGKDEVEAVGHLYDSTKKSLTEYLKGHKKDDRAVERVSDGVVKAAVKLAAWGINTKTHPGDESAEADVQLFVKKLRKAAQVPEAALSKAEQRRVINLGHFSAIGAVDQYLKSVSLKQAEKGDAKGAARTRTWERTETLERNS